MDGKATQAPAPRLRVTPKRERATARMEVHITTSELAALKRMAGHEGYVPTKWVVARIRIKMSCSRLSHGGSSTASRAIYSVVGLTFRGSSIEAAESCSD
ncbi:MAG: hypothetical protein KF890_14735 [Nitrospira sp.]|jgi:hypothetical protein|nr:hypothetical protein [Nitrospira sp.]